MSEPEPDPIPDPEPEPLTPSETDSILDSIKKLVGFAPEDPAFDLDVKMHINAAFGSLQQLGVGPVAGFVITDRTNTWDSFVDDRTQQSMIKNYVYLKTRLIFDPPATSFTITALDNLAKELEWRLCALASEGGVET